VTPSDEREHAAGDRIDSVVSTSIESNAALSKIQQLTYPTAGCLRPDEVADCISQAYLPDERFEHLLNCKWCNTLLVASFPGGEDQGATLLGTSLDDLLMQAARVHPVSSVSKTTGLRKRFRKWLSTYFPDLTGSGA
jgi:hypothetical protein